MIRATIILYLLAFLCVVVGLWDHSWQLILAGTTLLVVWPIVQEEVTPHETHHNPDDGGDRRSTPGVRLSPDSRLLDGYIPGIEDGEVTVDFDRDPLDPRNFDVPS